jgi:hypothetical protein
MMGTGFVTVRAGEVILRMFFFLVHIFTKIKIRYLLLLCAYQR